MIKDPSTRLLELLVPEYQHSTNFIKYLQVLTDAHDEVYSALQDVKTLRYLENATGTQLDTIGYIVGQPRLTYKVLNGEFFGFLGAIGGESFGTESDPNVGGIFLSESDEEFDFELQNDEDYKKFILAKIIKNHKRLTTETIIEVTTIITDKENFEITQGNKSFNIHFNEELSGNEKLLFTTPGFIPKPLGVKMTFSDNLGSF